MENILNIDNWILVGSCIWKLCTIWWPVFAALIMAGIFVSWSKEKPV